MRLIDADWVLAHLWTYDPSDEEWNVTGGTALRLIHKAVDNAPTVDAVVVTRCKDCKEYRSEPNSWNGHPFCRLSDEYVEYDDYCAWANRKDDEHEVN